MLTSIRNWVNSAKNASRETQIFIIVAFIFIAPIILGAIYSYARLDFVRSYNTSSTPTELPSK